MGGTYCSNHHQEIIPPELRIFGSGKGAEGHCDSDEDEGRESAGCQLIADAVVLYGTRGRSCAHVQCIVILAANARQLKRLDN